GWSRWVPAKTSQRGDVAQRDSFRYRTPSQQPMKGLMTVVMNKSEAPARVNDNSDQQWILARGLDKVDSATSRHFAAFEQTIGAASSLGMPEINLDGQYVAPFRLDEPLRPQDQLDGIIGSSASLRDVLAQVKIVAPTSSTVLLLGETGTG